VEGQSPSPSQKAKVAVSPFTNAKKGQRLVAKGEPLGGIGWA